MKAIGYTKPGLAHDPKVLQDLELPRPKATGRDLLIEVKAISVNPVDVKVRAGSPAPADAPKILGWDVAGIVVETGPEASLFQVGDEVWYAGDLSRPGGNSEFHLVDERIVGFKPQSLDFAAAAALPLTTITAYEMLFDRLQLSKQKGNEGETLLVVGAAGGVGSVLIQLAKHYTSLNIIATASRPETKAWVMQMGADQAIDHNRPLSEELEQLGISEVDYVISLNHTESHFPEIVKVLKPQGKFGLIDDPALLNAMPLKRKSISLHWELMFTRPLYQTADMIAQHQLLSEVAGLVDAGLIQTTLAENLGPIHAENLRKAHQMVESGKTKGKIVLAGF